MSEDQQPLNTKIDFSSGAFKKYFFNTSWLFAEKIFRLLVSFFVGILVIRYLGPGQFGLLSYAISFVGLFYAFSNLGLDTILVREFIKYPQRENEIMGTSLVLRLGGSFLALVLIAASAFLFNNDSETIYLILIISVSAVFQSFYIIDFYFQSKVLAKNSAIVQFSSLIITAAIKLLLILLKADLIYFAIVTALEFFIIGFNFLLVYRLTGSNFLKWRYNKTLATSLIKDAWPLLLSVLAITTYMKIDQVMIKNMLDDDQVGIYAAAVKLTEAWYFIPIAIITSLFPAILNAKKVNEALYINRLQKLYDLLVLIAVSVALPVTLFSTSVINILLGDDYSASTSILNIYIWGSLAVFLAIATNQFLVTENYTKLNFYRTLAGLVINIILNLILIPLWGITGAAVATLFSQTVVLFSIYLDKRTSFQAGMILKALFMVNTFRFIYQKMFK